ncbi:family 43 glycosylhydrolase [Massilia sp. B-10]|nr:family 43 glycosylhydrolase [Massilia sp. B-10]
MLKRGGRHPERAAKRARPGHGDERRRHLVQLHHRAGNLVFQLEGHAQLERRTGARVQHLAKPWISAKIPGFGGSFWAPDVIHMNGYYYLYYSVSTFGTSSSAIGVARSASLRNPSWQDLGIVVESFGGSSEINAIDPALMRDHDGKVYLSYGSFFGGIGLAEINQASGKLA